LKIKCEVNAELDIFACSKNLPICKYRINIFVN